MIKKLLDPIRNPTNFSKNVAKVTSGSAISAVVYFVGIKFVAEIYSPEVFGNYGLLTSIITIFSMAASLKYEAAIPITEEADDRFHIAWVALLSLALTTAVLGVAFLVAGSSILRFLKAEPLLPYVHLVVLGIFAKSLFQIGQFVLVSWRAFSKLSRLKVAQAILIQGIMIGYGFYSASLMGLYLGFFVGNLLTGLLSIQLLLKKTKQLRWTSLKEVAFRYGKFPAINAPATLISSFANQLPVLMLSRYAGPEIVGFYTFAIKLVEAPMNVVTQSVSQVYVEAASKAYHAGGNALYHAFKNTLEKMALIGIGPAIAAFIFSPWVVSFVFGEEWRMAGVVVQIIIAMKYLQFINAPISTTYSIIDKQELTLYLIIFSIVLRFAAMYLFRYDEMHMLIALTVSGSIFFIVYNAVIQLSIKKLPTSN